MLDLYRDLLAHGLPPDTYTYVALLTAMARAGSPLHVLEDVASAIRASGLPLNMQLGTALINAYKRTPEMAVREPRVVPVLLERAGEVLRVLASARQASGQTYALVAAMHAQVGSCCWLPVLLARSHVGPAAECAWGVGAATSGAECAWGCRDRGPGAGAGAAQTPPPQHHLFTHFPFPNAKASHHPHALFGPAGG